MLCTPFGWRNVAQMLAQLPEMAAWIGNDCLPQAPRLVSWRVDQLPTCRKTSLDRGIHILNEGEDHGREGLASRMGVFGLGVAEQPEGEDRSAMYELSMADAAVGHGHPHRHPGPESGNEPLHRPLWIGVSEMGNDHRITAGGIEHH